MKHLTATLLMLTLCASNVAVYGQQANGEPRSREYWFAYAGKLPIGSTVRVRTTDGMRHTAVLAMVDQDGITLEPRTRVPEPPRRIPFDHLVQLELKQNGSSVWKAVAIGAGVGAGAFLGILMILAASLA
jgi:hypothetical protein